MYAILSKCNIFDSFSLLDQLPPLSQLKPTPWSTSLSGVTTTRRLATFTKSFYVLPIGSFPTFKGLLTSLAKTLLKCLLSGLFTFQQCHFKFPMGFVMLISLDTSMLILFPKLEPPWLLPWFLVPLSSYFQNSLHPVSQMETFHFHIPNPI